MKILNRKLLEDIKVGNPLKLEFGAGGRSTLGDFYALDKLNLDGVDIVADLNYPLDLFPDNCCSKIYSQHTFEHVAEFMLLMQEIWRICRKDATIEIVVPHFSNPLGYSDPTHVRFFGLYTMHYFVDESLQISSTRKVPSFYSQTRFSVNSIYLNFYRANILDRLFVPFFRAIVNSSFSSQEFYEKRLSWLFPAWQISYEMSPQKE